MQKIASGKARFRFGLFQADVADGTLTRNGVRVKIQDQPFRVLLVLLERAGEIVSRDELRARVWPEGTFVDFDGSLNVILKKLRAALNDDPENPRFIETVPRRGYRFIAPVTATREETSPRLGEVANNATGLSAPFPPALPPHRSPIATRYLVLGATAVILLAAGTIGFVRWQAARSFASASTMPANSLVHVRSSVAVLGFRDLSERQNESWLGTALGEMLSTELAGGDKLRLVSTEDVANLHAYSPWPHADTLDQATTSRIGTALGSDLVVLGSYALIGKPGHEKLRVDARLQECKSGEVLSEIAEIGAAEDLFGIVSRIGSKLRSRVGIAPSVESDDVLILSSLPANPEAARFYSLGLEKLRSYDFPVARGFFEQAIAAEPRFSLAHAMLSRADLFLGRYDQAKTEAKQGLDLATDLPRVQRMQIQASYYQAMGDRGKAAEIYRVLFNLFPDSLDYGIQLAKLQLDSYHPEEALETLRQLRQLPSPYRDDPVIDLRESFTIGNKDKENSEKLLRTAAQKASAQGKKLVFAKAEQYLCYMNPQHLASPPECKEAYDTYLAAGNMDAAASTLQLMAEDQRLTGHDDKAIPLYEQAIRTFLETTDYENAGVALNNLSLIYEIRGQFALAEQQYLQAKKYFAAVNDRINLAIAICNIADIETWRGNFQAAEQMYRQSWEMQDAAKAAQDESPHIQHANLLLMRGQLNEATAEITAQLASLRTSNSNPWETASALTTLGEIQRHQADFDSSKKNFDEAAQVLKSANASTAANDVNLAEISVDRGQFENAERQLRKAIANLETDKDLTTEFSASILLARSLLGQSKVTEARAAMSKARTLIDVRAFPIYSIPLETVELQAKAAAAPAGGREALLVAQRDLKVIINRAHQIGFYNAECEARLALGEVETKLSPATASAHLTALASDTSKRGLRLYSDEINRVNGHMDSKTLALNKPSR